MRHLWGVVKVGSQRLINRAGEHCQMLLDKRLDDSGFSPCALERLVELAGRLPFEEAAQVAERFDLKVSRSELERSVRPYLNACQAQVTEALLTPPAGMLEGPSVASTAGRIMVLQVDGVQVLGQPQARRCPGMEVKSAVLYPQAAPSERFMLAELCEAQRFVPLVAGLLQHAQLTPQDTLIGLGDGALWVEDLLDTMGAVRITDVYHSAEYLEQVMQALGWDEVQRERERIRWCKGEIAADAWLRTHLPDPERWLSWTQEAIDALAYLEKRTPFMDYPSFKAKGYPIGSGQVEGMNKSVIGTRMKRSGMHWSRSGAAAMASFRAQLCAKHPLVHFDTLRHHAYPPVPT